MSTRCSRLATGASTPNTAVDFASAITVREESAHEARLARLRAALEEGEASGEVEDYSIERVIAELDG
jgi:hypothetical protein